MLKRKREPYADRSLQLAVGDVKTNRLNCYKAALEYNVPRSTIYDHVKGKFVNSKTGPQRMLTDLEETSLVSYMKYVGDRGFPISRKMLKSFVIAIVKESGRDTLFNMEKGPSDKWCRSFLERHPDLKEKTPEAQDKARAKMSNWTVMNQYFNLLEKTVNELGLTAKPSQIFNCDESGFSGKERSRQKVIVTKNTHAYQQSNLTNSHITVHLCIGADGRVLPAYVIFEGSLPHRSFTDGVPTDWLYGTSESGYMDFELFESWFEKVFLQFCGSRRPVLLIFDNHDSHISLPLLKKARENDIHILGLPPHTTHILQPLDVAIFGPLKEKVASLATSLGFLNANLLIGKAKFPAILSSAIDHICSPAKIKYGFSKCGMYPVDINAIDKTQVGPLDDHRKQDKESNNDTEKIISSDVANVLCHNCGTSIDVCVEDFAPVNPLVANGLIPENLAKILVPPSTVNGGQKKKSAKLVTEARVLTGEDMIRRLEEKEENARKAEEEKENRKIERIKKREEKERATEEKREAMEERKKERERKRKEKEQEKKQKKVTKERKRMRRDDALNLCIMCYEADPEGGIHSNMDILWYQCSVCDGWAHQLCTSVRLGEEENYVCDECVFALEE